jgi:hypothetical protein
MPNTLQGRIPAAAASSHPATIASHAIIAIAIIATESLCFYFTTSLMSHCDISACCTKIKIQAVQAYQQGAALQTESCSCASGMR